MVKRKELMINTIKVNWIIKKNTISFIKKIRLYWIKKRRFNK